MQKKTVIVSAYPCCGKTYAFNHQQKYSILDSDSSLFSWLPELDENGNKIRNPEFPNNYIQHIKSNIGKVDIIFVSSHLQVRKALKEASIDYVTVYPKLEMKDVWLKRMKDRGNDESFIKFQEEHWEEFIKKVIFEPYGFCMVWLSDEFLNVDYLYDLGQKKEEIERSYY